MKEKTEKLLLLIEDIKCHSCVSLIKKNFEKYKKSNNLKINFDFIKNNVIFEYKLNKNLNYKIIIEKIKNLSYKIYSFEVLESPLKNKHFHESSTHEKHFVESHKKRLFVNKFIFFKIKFFFFSLGGFFFLIYDLIKPDVLNNFWWNLFLFFLASFLCYFLGKNFFKKTLKEIFLKQIGMNFLITFSLINAYLLSLVNFIYQKKELYFHFVILFLIFLKIGEEINSIIKKRINFERNMSFHTNEEKVIKISKNDLFTQKIISLSEIKKGDYLLVKKENLIPTDGILISNDTIIDESTITGENLPVNKKKNDFLIGNTLNKGNSFLMKATKIGKETIVENILLAEKKIINLKPRLKKISDKVALFFTPLIIAVSILSFLVLFFFTENNFVAAMTRMITIAAIACPCAVGMVVPLLSNIGKNKALKNGIIYQDENIFDTFKETNIICFDKTGTLTNGYTIKNYKGNEKYLPLAIKMQLKSTHPFSIAFQELAAKIPTQLLKKTIFKDFSEEIGFGLRATFNKKNIIFTSWGNLQKTVDCIDEYKIISKNKRENNKLLCLVSDKKIKLIFKLTEIKRLNAKQLIKKFQKNKFEIILISGDKQANVEKIATEFQIKKFFAETTPIEKAEIVKNIQKNSKKKVIYVGDGINDSLALLQADVGICSSETKNSALKNSNIAIIKNDLMNVWKAIYFAKITNKLIFFNLLWLFSYNIIMVSLAALDCFSSIAIAPIAMIASEIGLLLVALFFAKYKFKFKI